MARRIALLFPGQAAQHVGMGRLAVERFPQARTVFERVDAALGSPISRVCFEGSAEQLQETRWQQPAIFACSMALYAAWREDVGEDDRLVGAAGHSLGEYSALVAAGAIGLEDGARLVAARGQAMQDASDREPGGMCALLGMDRAAVEALCADASDPAAGPAGMVVLANDNAPGQQVISGGLAALERAIAMARARGARRVVPLKVAGAFHSPLMAPALGRLRDALAGAAIAACRFPVIANSSAEELASAGSIGDELVRQITAPVRWVESVRALAGLEPHLWVDAGPGNVVAGLAARIVPGVEPLTLSTLIDAPAPA